MIKVKLFTFNPVQENTYVLTNEKGQSLIIDPGCYFSAEQEALKNFLDEQSFQPVQLINTHCHLDHVFGNKWIWETYGLELFIHPEEEKMLQAAPASGLFYGLSFDNYNAPLHFLNEGDVVRLGEDELKVIAVPGHSPGSICLYSEKDGFLMGGDVLFKESIGRTDLPYGNHEQLLKNIREKLYNLPGDVVIYPGHGEPTTIGYEKRNNPFVQGM